ncbi:unnamed protein product [Camellia sinensis]
MSKERTWNRSNKGSPRVDVQTRPILREFVNNEELQQLAQQLTVASTLMEDLMEDGRCRWRETDLERERERETVERENEIRGKFIG